MTWDSGSCQSKEQALKMLAEQIEYLYKNNGYLNSDVVDIIRGEMECFAAKWSIPFCWELHEQLLARKTGYYYWDSSDDCIWDRSDDSWDSSDDDSWDSSDDSF